MSEYDDISHLDFDIPDDLLDEVLDIGETKRPSLIITRVTEVDFLVAICVKNNIDAVVFCFEEEEDAHGEVFDGGIISLIDNNTENTLAAVKKLTENIFGLQAVALTYNMGDMSTDVWEDGEVVQNFPPTLVMSGFDEDMDDIIFGITPIEEANVGRWYTKSMTKKKATQVLKKYESY